MNNYGALGLGFVSASTLASGYALARQEHLDFAMQGANPRVMVKHEAAFDNRSDGRLVATEFYRLLNEWRSATNGLSSVRKVFSHPAYIAISNMGKPVLPLLFMELQTKPDWWFAVLQKITGDDPVPAQDRGDLEKMTQHWLNYYSKSNEHMDA